MAAQNQNPERLARIQWYNEHKAQLWNRIVQRLQEGQRHFSRTTGYRMTRNDHEPVFSCPLVCMRCVGWKNNGQQCSRTTCKYLPVCHSHALSMYNIAVKETNNVGLGLFAKNRRRATGRAAPLFVRNDVICPYLGEKMTRGDLDERYDGPVTATYGWVDSEWDPNANEDEDDRPTWDAACVRGIGSFANSGDGRQPAMGPIARGFVGQNASIMYSNRTGWPVIVAIDDIYDGQEIIVDYGENYDYTDAIHRTGRGRFQNVDLSWPYHNGYEGLPNFQVQDFPGMNARTRKRKSTTKTKKRTRRKS